VAQSQVYYKKGQMALIEEANQDEYEAPVAGALVLAREITITFDGGNFDPEFHRGDVLNMDETAAPLSISMNYKIPIKGSGVAGDPPESGEMLKSAGLAETDGASDVIYRRTNTFDGVGGNPGCSYSAHFLVDGSMFSLRGGFSNLQILTDVNNIGMFDFTTMGAPPETGDAYRAQALLTPSYDPTRAPAYRGAGFTTNFGGAFPPVGHTGRS